MKKLFLIIAVFIAVTILSLTTGCRTEYYPPVGDTYTKVDGKIYGAVHREGIAPWSDGDGKVINLPLSKLSIIGK